LQLANKHQALLADRFPAGLVHGLETDLGAIKGLVAGSKTARARSVAATARQAGALVDGHALVSAIRTAVARSGASKATQRAYGVGRKVSKSSVKSIVGALQQIIERADLDPDEARSLGLIEADVGAARDALEAVLGADARQEDLRAAAPASTRTRNAAARRILTAIERVAGAGVLAFATRPATRRQFEALLGHGSRKPRRKPVAA
jgi:hypothetical protein